MDFNHGATKGKAGVPGTDLLDLAAATIEGAREQRTYLGGSRLGEICQRKLLFEYQGAPRERPMTAKTHLIFASGHFMEERQAKLLIAAGLDLRTHDRHGGQFGFSVAGDRIKGHIDGVVCGGPADLGPYPYLWEHKFVGGKYWTAIVKKGVALERPVYAAQIAIYQAYMGLEENAALFQVTNRDTLETAFERVPFNTKLAQTASDRGVAVLNAHDAGALPPRAHASADFFECRWCDFHNRCWGQSNGVSA